MTGDARDWRNLLTGFFNVGSFYGLIGPSLIDPVLRRALTESEACNATYGAVLSWPGHLTAQRVLVETAGSISEHKKHPMAFVAAGKGMAVAVLNRNEPAFTSVPAHAFEELMDLVEDQALGRLADVRLAAAPGSLRPGCCQGAA
jgi:antitoxin StbD